MKTSSWITGRPVQVVGEVWAREGKSGLVRITEVSRCWKRGSLRSDVSEFG